LAPPSGPCPVGKAKRGRSRASCPIKAQNPSLVRPRDINAEVDEVGTAGIRHRAQRVSRGDVASAGLVARGFGLAFISGALARVYSSHQGEQSARTSFSPEPRGSRRPARQQMARRHRYPGSPTGSRCRRVHREIGWPRPAREFGRYPRIAVRAATCSATVKLASAGQRSRVDLVGQSASRHPLT